MRVAHYLNVIQGKICVFFDEQSSKMFARKITEILRLFPSITRIR